MTEADEATRKEIATLCREWLDAARRRDGATLDRILADDFLICGWQPEGRVADKRFYIEDCLKPVEIEGGSYRFDQWQVRRYGDTAVVGCTLDIRARVGGQEWGGEVLVSDVWVRDGGSWRVVARHTSPIVRASNPAAAP